jgi:hypothetical protein
MEHQRYTCPEKYIEKKDLLDLLNRLFPDDSDFDIQVTGPIPT